MRKDIQKLLILLVPAVFVAGCQNPPTNEDQGTVIGAVAGGILGAVVTHGGSTAAGAAVGAIAGGLIGNVIGRSVDQQDVRESNGAFARSTRMPAGQTVYWSNTRTGNWGSYSPLRDGHSRFDGYYCREFVSTATMNGRTERVYGTACRHPNGTWHAIN